MIINEFNKNLLSNKMKRGFNQTPRELKERLYNELHIKKPIETEIKKEVKIEDEKPKATRMNEALRNLKKMGK